MLDLQIRWEGVEDLVAVLAQLPARLRERAIRPAVDKATRLVARAMKGQLKFTRRVGRGRLRARARGKKLFALIASTGGGRMGTGLLLASLGTRVVAKLNRAVYGIAGPRRSTRGKGETRAVASWRKRREAKSPGLATVKPTRYAHLVEKGHARGRGRGRAYPRPFMRPAVTASRSAVAGILRSELTRQISRFATLGKT